MVRASLRLGHPVIHRLRVVHRICGYPRASSDHVLCGGYDGGLSLRKDTRRGVPTVSTNDERFARLEEMRVDRALGGGAGSHREAARRRQADGARTTRPAARSRVVRRARCIRHAPTTLPAAEIAILGDGVVTGHGDDRRPASLRLQPGLHGLRWFAVRGVRREDLQGHGPCDEGRRADHRPQRFGGSADPGGRRLARWLRRHLPAQRPRVRGRAADLGDPGAVRRWRGLFAGDHRLHGDGRGHELHVRHRTRTS